MAQSTIRRSLLKHLSLLILLTAGVILGVTLYEGLTTIEEFSRSEIELTTAQAEEQLDRFFGVVHDRTLMIRGWVEDSLADIHDPHRLSQLFTPMLVQNHFLSSLMIANSLGHEYLIERDPVERTRWLNMIVRPTSAGEEVFLREWDTRADTVHAWQPHVDFDPRERPWYQAALETTEEDPVHWTTPAIIYGTRDPGIVAASHVTLGDDPDVTSVVAVDVLLADISRFLGSLDGRAHGRAFVLFEDPSDGSLKVLAFPADEETYSDLAIRNILTVMVADTTAEPNSDGIIMDSVPLLRSADGFHHPVIGDAEIAWVQRGRMRGQFDFEHDGDTWWAAFHPYHLGPNQLWIGVAVPEKALLGDMPRRVLIIILAAVLGLIVAAIASALMARSYSEPLVRLAESSRRIGNLDLTDHGEWSTNLREVDQLAREQERMRATLDSFSRYVPVELVRELLATGEAAKIGGSRRTITALFSDIVGFTTISEALGPEKLTIHMAEYFEMVLEIFQTNSGDVNQLLGDGVLAYWGAPKTDPDHARHAVEAVIECRERLDTLNLEWHERGLPALPTRFGLAAGEVMVGNVGSRSRLAYAAVGDTVNLASRIEGLTRFYSAETLASGSVKEMAGEGFEWMHVDSVRVKGKTEAVDLFEPLGRAGQVDPGRLAFRDAYERARQHFLRREFSETLSLLNDLSPEERKLLMVVRLAEASTSFLVESPDDGWDGVTNFKVK